MPLDEAVGIPAEGDRDALALALRASLALGVKFELSVVLSDSTTEAKLLGVREEREEKEGEAVALGGALAERGVDALAVGVEAA